MPGSAWNWRRTSLITLTAARVTAPIASAENQNTSIAPSRPPTNTSGFEMSTAASGEPRARTSSRYAENRRKAASAAEPIAYPLVSALVVLPTASRRSRSEEHTSELQSPCNLVCRLLLEKKKKTRKDLDQVIVVVALVIDDIYS